MGIKHAGRQPPPRANHAPRLQARAGSEGNGKHKAPRREWNLALWSDSIFNFIML